MDRFIETIASDNSVLRERDFRELCADMDSTALLRACDELESFRQKSDNLYERVRATLFL